MMTFEMISDIINNSGYRNGILAGAFALGLILFLVLVFVYLDWDEKRSKKK